MVEVLALIGAILTELLNLFFGLGIPIPVSMGFLPIVLGLGALGGAAAAGATAATAIGLAGLGFSAGSYLDSRKQNKKLRKEQQALQAEADAKAASDLANKRRLNKWQNSRLSGSGMGLGFGSNHGRIQQKRKLQGKM